VSNADFPIIDWVTTTDGALPLKKIVNSILVRRDNESSELIAVWSGVLEHSLGGGPLRDRLSGTLRPEVAIWESVELSILVGHDSAGLQISGPRIPPEMGEAWPISAVTPFNDRPFSDIAAQVLTFDAGDAYEIYIWPGYRW